MNYYDQGGWDRFEWQGVTRARFAVRQVQVQTADSSRYVMAGECEGLVAAGNSFEPLFSRLAPFAGIVCIQD
jgi:hypothetical protein